MYSGKEALFPVGDVQIRIDANKAWDIAANETPNDLAPKVIKSNPVDGYANVLPPKERALMEASYKAILENVNKSSSPYTVATGKKAQSILQEMLQGQVMKARIVGFGRVNSTTGVYPIDDSLRAALEVCKIHF